VSVDPATFASEHWSSAPLLSRSEQLPAGFEDLLSAGDVDELVTRRGLREPFFRLVRAGEPVRGVTRTVTAGSRRVADFADPDRVREAYQDGATLVLNSLHRTHPPVGRFCRQLAADLGHPTQCNAYLTPGGGARGFAYHHDTHDVFILQLSGTKTWQVYAPALELPLPSQPSSGDHLVSPTDVPLLDVVLTAGDALYLPRGYVHAAATTDDASMHLTIGVLAVTWFDVLQDMLVLAADEPSMRACLPVRPDASRDLAGFPVRAGQWLAGLPAEQVERAVAARLARAVPPEPIGLLAQAKTEQRLGPDSWVRPRDGLTWTLSDGEGRVVLALPDRTVTLPERAGPALRAVLGAPSRVDDLPGVDSAGGLVLVHRLLREGVLLHHDAPG